MKSCLAERTATRRTIMAYKLLKASTYYPSALQWYYNSRISIGNEPYERQHRDLMEVYLGWGDSWQRHLQASGHFRVEEIVVNAEPLQKKWAAERGLRYDPENWAADIFFAQCDEFKPDIIFAHSHDVLLRWWSDARARALDDCFVIGYDGTAKHLPAFAERCDLMLTCLKRSVAHYEGDGLKSIYFPYGFEDAMVSRLTPHQFGEVAASFVGGIALNSGHVCRAIDLAELSHHLPINYWLSQVPTNDKKLLRLIAAVVWSRNWQAMYRFSSVIPAIRRLVQVNNGELYGIDMLSALAASKLTLNMHNDAAGNEAGNIRLFEATGVGACLLTDWKPNLGEFFEPDSEIVTFKSIPEAVDKANYLLAHDTERMAIAQRGQARTRREHSTKARIEEVASLLRGIV